MGNAKKMKIELEKLPLKHLERFNGGEKELAAYMYVDERNKILKGRLVSGASIGYHCHATSSEIILILSGTGTMLYNEDESGIENARRETLDPGDCHYCPRGAYHSLRNDAEEDLVFFAIVPQQ